MHELVSLAAARWNTKDDLKAMQGKQESQYWKMLRAHMKEKDPTWDRESGQMSMAWKRIEKEYLDTQWKEGTSGGKAIKKKPWWDYVYHLRKHFAKAKAHALDGGGAATINVDAYASVPAQNDPQSSGAPSPTRARGAQLQPSTPGVTPPAKRCRIEETATMAAAKLVSKAINSTNASTLRQLQDSTQLLVAAMHMAAL
ncbi:unnamed protein product [Closterium sp. NIES-64]|nr:unnamed protein product [Closterium sp. NIES-64]